MRSANQFFAEVHEERLKDCRETATQADSANRRWQANWRRKHPVIYKNQSLLYYLAGKIRDQLIEAFVELELPDDDLYSSVKQDLQEAFASELTSRAGGQPQLIGTKEITIAMSRTERLLNSRGVFCKVFYRAIDGRKIYPCTRLERARRAKNSFEAWYLGCWFRTLIAFRYEQAIRAGKIKPEGWPPLPGPPRIKRDLHVYPVSEKMGPYARKGICRILAARRGSVIPGRTWVRAFISQSSDPALRTSPN